MFTIKEYLQYIIYREGDPFPDRWSTIWKINNNYEYVVQPKFSDEQHSNYADLWSWL